MLTLLFYLSICLFSLIFFNIYCKLKNIFDRQLEKQYIYYIMSIFMLGISFLILFVPLAFRYQVGADYNTYANAFLHVTNNAMSETDRQWLGIGFIFICKLIGLFNRYDYVMMFAIVAFLSLYFLYMSIIKLSSNKILSLYLFISTCLYFQMFNQSRQLLAITITMYALYYLKNDKKIKYILLIVLAGLIHNSAFIMLPLVLLYKYKIKKRDIFILLMVGLFMFLNFNLVLKAISLTSYGKIYLGWAQYDQSFTLSSILNLAVRVILLIGCLIVMRETATRSRFNSILLFNVVICTIIQLFTVRSYLFGRISTYFFSSYIFLIPEVLKSYENILFKKYKNIMLLLVYIAFFVYLLVYYFSPQGAQASGYDIYRSIFQK